MRLNTKPKFNSGATGRAMLAQQDKEDGIAYTRVLPEVTVDGWSSTYTGYPTMEDMLNYVKLAHYGVNNFGKSGYRSDDGYLKFNLTARNGDTIYMASTPTGNPIPFFDRNLYIGYHKNDTITPNFNLLRDLFNSITVK